MENFRCQTKIISGTNYHVAIWRGETKEGKAVGFCSFPTEEQAKSFCEGLKHHPYYEITPNHWTKEVCIECGQDVY